MAEIASGGGALLVDPRDDASLVDGLERLLTDEATHSRLRAEAAARDRRSWDDYARETWALLVDEGAARP
jgi:glycosyltransferase involved in cell wall biosynthesis